MSAAAEGFRGGLDASTAGVSPYLNGQGAHRSVPPKPGNAVAVVSPSKSLAVHIETLVPAAMTARIVLANHSQRALLAVDLAAFLGSQRIVSDRRKSPRNEPLVLGHGEYAFDLAAPFDRLVVTSVLWDDGSVEGDPGLLADERVLDIGKAAGLRRVMKLLREYGDLADRQSPGGLRARLAVLSVIPDVPSSRGEQLGMQQVKDAVLEDVIAFERAQPSPNAAAWRSWLDQTINAYEDWFARIAAR
jgi:hypothetical protein